MNAYEGLRLVWSADPELVAARKAAEAGEFEPALAAIEAEHGDARHFVCKALTQSPKPPNTALEARAEAEPGRASIRTLHGAWLLEYGWSIRGGGVASGVSDEAFMGFHQALEAAKQKFEAAIELDPGDPTPWVFLIEIARCEGQPKEAQRCFDEATARDPHNFGAHRQLLGTKTAKWGGSEEQMMAFVDRVRATTPPGSLLHLLEIEAQIERWLWRFGFQDDRDAAIALAYDETVRERVDAAVEAARSAPEYLDRRQSVLVRNALAFWYFVSGRMGDLRGVLEGLDGVFSEAYWGYLNAPPFVYARARFRAGLGPDPAAEADDSRERDQQGAEPSNPYAPQAGGEAAEVGPPPGPGMLIYAVALLGGAGLIGVLAVSRDWGFLAWLLVFILGVSGLSVLVNVIRSAS